jgi:methylglutaconyl-CoA hydratase
MDQCKVTSKSNSVYAVYETLVTSFSDRGIATIELNRPERGNALNHQLIEELVRHLGELAADDRTRLIVLRGAGRHFCTGADVAQLRNAAPASSAPVTHVPLLTLMEVCDAFPKPTVALVQGGCVGAGVALASCFDVVIAIEKSFFSYPELRLGLVPSGLLPYFVRAVGYRAFRRYGISGERIPAADAHHLGLVHQLSPEVLVEKHLDEITDALLHAAPGAIRHLKQRLVPYAAMPASSEQPTEEDQARNAEIQEGTSSFRKKEKPSWYPPQP